MTLSLQEISDRMEIQDLCYHYADIIDRHAFDELVDVFTEDAHIDYSEVGGSEGGLAETIDFLKKAMTMFPNYHHLNANLQIKVDGETATGRIMCFNPMEVPNEDGSVAMMMVGIWYVDKYLRTAQGWRITRRAEEKSYMFHSSQFGQPSAG